LTALPVAACADLAVDGGPAKILRVDATSGLTLVGGGFGAGAEAPALVSDATELVALSLAPAVAGKARLEASPGAAAGEGGAAIVVALAEGTSGAPAFDRQGRLAGVVAPLADKSRGVGGPAIAEPHKLIGAEAVAAFLGISSAAAPGEGAALSIAGLAARKRGALAEVTCRP
jgi:hypothetical protein